MHATMHPIAEIVVCVLLLIGSGFMLIGAIGLARLPDFYMRLHGPTKSTTLGVGGVVLASVVYFSVRGNGLSLHELLVSAFLFLTAPISAHMLAKAAIQQRLPVIERTRGRVWSPARSVADAGEEGHPDAGEPGK
ncbi:Na+/H+ antiporter subunit G [Cupriavidus sp. DL-D2]|uniref:Na+/H+ antiporter subunit G n=1 Tax=Cupriavidus sp. DL-D2 TaxID=3144974 RepID=UPI003212A525